MTDRRYDLVYYMPSTTSRLTGAPVSGGAETQVVLLTRALAQCGLSVALIVAGETELPDQVDGVNLIPRARNRERLRLFGKLYEGWAIYAALRNAPSPVVITQCAGVNVGIVAICARLLRRKFVYAVASDFDFAARVPGVRSRDQRFYELGIRLADTIVAQTERQRKLCAERFGREAVVVGSIAEPAEPRSGGEVFLWAGGLNDNKRPLAFVELARRVPGARFRLVGAPTPGTGLLGDEVRAAAEDVPNLEVSGPLPHSELLDLVGRAVAVVSTSVIEGVPNVFLEGWACGVPALALSHDPDGVIATYGLGVFAGDSMERLAAAAEDLWNSRNDNEAFALRCVEHVRRLNGPSRIAEDWARVLGLGTGSAVERDQSKVAA